MTGAAQVADALEQLGGFFALAAPPARGTDAVPWVEVLSETALEARFAAVRAALASSTGLPVEEVDPRVAVSATQVGLASRLWSVALAGAVLHSWVPDLSSAALVASPVHRGAVPLGVADPDRGMPIASTTEAAAVIGRTVTEGSLAALDEACARVGRTAGRVLLSNAASSLVGAGRVLASRRPEAADRTDELVRLLLAGPALSAGGSFAEDGTFLRSGCCLFYRLPEHGLCPDCVLAPAHPELVTEAH